jgi:hypothetical protein
MSPNEIFSHAAEMEQRSEFYNRALDQVFDTKSILQEA